MIFAVRAPAFQSFPREQGRPCKESARQQDGRKNTMSDNEESSNRFEMLTGLILAVFAAILAITDLGGGKYGGDEILAAAEKSNMFAWYQSKSVKESLVEGEKDLLGSLIASGTIRPEQVAGVQEHIADLEKKIAKYKKEKKEILLGSAAVGQENWVQDVKGELGKVIGAEEWQKTAEMLGRAGDFFDLGTLFLQICLVMGAISLVIHEDRLKKLFLGSMVVLGIIGTIYSIYAFIAAGAFG